jgi:hypothetical protein
MSDWGLTHAGRSFDNGYSWVQVTSLPVQFKWNFVYLGGAGVQSRWAAIGNSYIFITDNFGASWTRKDTYIPQFITPFPSYLFGFSPVSADIT